LQFYEVLLMIGVGMEEQTIIQALQGKLKEDMDTPEDVHYNEGIIDAIEEVKKQYLLHRKK
jgi:hypothetical protein